jgi:Prokaryotic homologs of the JAB domain
MLGWLNKIKLWWQGCCSVEQRQTQSLSTDSSASTPRARLERIVLTDGVAHTLFDDYAEHRRSDRGDEEIGWILLGLQHEGEATALAAIPAGAQRDAGRAHIRFNSEAQALASRIVRQDDKRLQIVGVVHTHPGSLRCPSDGDLQGDSLWVGQLRGGEGIFAIGTADVRSHEKKDAGGGHVQIYGNLCYSWYALGIGDRGYRPIPAQVTIGPDLALALRPLWNVIEANAEPLNKLCRQFAKVLLEVIDEEPAKLLCVKIALAEPKQQLRLLLSEGEARYYWDRQGELMAIDPHEPRVDLAVYLILAELAKKTAVTVCEAAALVES